MPHTPQQNGVAERKNRTMAGAAKAMLFDHGSPLFLRAEEYRTAVYIQNRCPHTALGRKTPEEVFTSTRKDVSHLCIFGSVCYCHVQVDTKKKLDPSREKGLLLGYKETSKAYRAKSPHSPILKHENRNMSNFVRVRIQSLKFVEFYP